MFSLIPKTDTGLWLSPRRVQSTSSSLILSRAIWSKKKKKKGDSFSNRSSSRWQHSSCWNCFFMHLREFRLLIHIADKSSLQPYCLYATSHQESSPPKGPAATIFVPFLFVTNPLSADRLP